MQGSEIILAAANGYNREDTMAVRKQLWHPDEVKQRIQASQLINRLHDHALSAEPIMTDGQVRAAFGLLGKVVPDLKAIEVSGPGANGEHVINVNIGG